MVIPYAILSIKTLSEGVKTETVWVTDVQILNIYETLMTKS
jgi:hypothetical protein